ncbi:MAG: glycosyltransferase family 4 protein [Anaerolineales bacterium]|nr:glycosyltransferase family 4 protein [Anaerolineales bacterium]
MTPPPIDQFIDSAHPTDAITGYALLLQKWLHEAGIGSTLYARTIAPSMRRVAQPLHRDRGGAGRVALYHHSIGSPIVDHLLAQDGPLVVIYHNVTPPAFVADSNPALAAKLLAGQQQLQPLAQHAILGVAVSAFNEADLRGANFRQTCLLPLALSEAAFDQPPLPAILRRFADGEWVLFVGRIVPNKRQEDLVKLLHHLRKRRPRARLALVGEGWDPTYQRWLQQQIKGLGLDDAVWLAGRLSQAELVNCFRAASLYLSMSEHEGVGLPLIEAMHLGLPVLAYAADGVAETVGEGGVLFHRKELAALAELVTLLLDDAALRRQLIAAGQRRAADFSEAAVRRQFMALLRMVKGE